MARSWSRRLQDAFKIDLPPDVIDWFDRGIYDDPNLACRGLFSEPVSPEGLLDASSCEAAGGLMLPDTLPILGDGAGNALVLRFDPQGQVTEALHWNQEGGLWRPFGQTLAEAILCDVADCKARGEILDEDENEEDCFDAWAAGWVAKTSMPGLRWNDPRPDDPLSLVQVLLQAGLCEIFCCRELCRTSLGSGFEQMHYEMGGDEIGDQLGVDWLEMQDWLLDTALIPKKYHRRLVQILDYPLDEILCQDWGTAAAHARRACELRPDLGWPHGVMGYNAQRSQNYGEAIEHYATNLAALSTSDDFLERHEGRFATYQLRKLQRHIPAAIKSDELLATALAEETPEDFPSRIRRYWVTRAEAAEKEADYALAYTCYYNAGWDDFVSNDIRLILDKLARNAQKAGFKGLHRIAKHHIASMEQ